ncbi:MarR family winged helix-turn-helix transcriptional regulator [Woodsholea maritima]|uniref:MarR family winged helix-turn-helix transcriptional regulator n=1 Tax=Woodsholea maritima TaxID=240237 RepID=UPI00037A140F|nr:MarR family transcriptional regulator [Woodsholea maritima]
MAQAPSRTSNAKSKTSTDHVVDQWRREHPELDARVMAVFGDLWRANDHSKKIVTQNVERFGLDFPRFDVLMTLRRQGKDVALSPTALAKEAMLSTSAMTNRLDKLEKDGLIVREHDLDDRRAIKIRLTPKGFDLVEDMLISHVETEEGLLSALCADERQTLRALLQKIGPRA